MHERKPLFNPVFLMLSGTMDSHLLGSLNYTLLARTFKKKMVCVLDPCLDLYPGFRTIFITYDL